MAAGWSVAQLAQAVQESSAGRLTARILGSDAVVLRAVAPLAVAQAGQLGFFANRRYRSQLAQTSASAVVLDAAEAEAVFGADQAPPTLTLIVCEQPYAWYAYAAQRLAPPFALVPGVSAHAQVHPTARIDAGAQVDALAVIGADAIVEADVWIGAASHVGAQARVGAGSRLFPHACLLDRCELGARGILHSGAVIGADGFGFAPLDGRWIKIPQTGRVLLGADVEIGANTTIDRGAMGDTVIEDGVKIDNQVQIAHNCRVGAHTVIAGCVGIAGSTTIGRHCQFGGAAMIVGHIEICDGTVVMGGTLISRSIRTPGTYSGSFPFLPQRDWERNAALVRHLDELRNRVRQLERRVAQGSTHPEEA